jgi:hypothetical protein
MKNRTDFTPKKEHKLLQLVGDKLVEIDFLIDRKSFFIIFEPIF